MPESTRIEYKRELNHNLEKEAIADELHINQSAVIKHLNTSKEKGVLERIGGTRGYWKVINIRRLNAN